MRGLNTVKTFLEAGSRNTHKDEKDSFRTDFCRLPDWENDPWFL
jgi:hypothetical protein